MMSMDLVSLQQIQLGIFSNFIERLTAIGFVILIVGITIVFVSIRQLMHINESTKKSLRWKAIQIFIGLGLSLYGLWLVYQSATLNLPGPT